MLTHEELDLLIKLCAAASAQWEVYATKDEKIFNRLEDLKEKLTLMYMDAVLKRE